MDLFELILEIAEGYAKFLEHKANIEELRNLNPNIKKYFQEVERRKRRLQEFKIFIPKNLPESVRTNLEEAMKCYQMDLNIASYALILRTIELAVSYYHEKFYPNKEHTNFKKMVDDLNKLTNINKTIINFLGAQYQERNKVIHELYIPSELDLLYALESTIKYVTKLSEIINKSLPPKQNRD